jgi:hypothetical protein
MITAKISRFTGPTPMSNPAFPIADYNFYRSASPAFSYQIAPETGDDREICTSTTTVTRAEGQIAWPTLCTNLF